jgi:integrase
MRIAKPFYRKSLQCWYLKLGKKFIRLSPDRDEAKRLYGEIMADRPAPVPDGTVDDLCRRFLAWVETDRPKSLKWYRMFVGSFRAHVGEKLTLAKLETSHIDAWVKERYTGTSTACRAGAVAAVSRVFGWARKKHSYKGENPATNAERPRVNPRGDEAYLSAEQIEKILSVIDETDPFKQLVYAMLYTGCRPQEARLVEVRHVDLTAKVWVFPPDEAKCGKKTGKPRTIYLDDNAVALTQRALLRAGGGKTVRLFRNRKGAPFTTAWINSKFRRLKKRTGFRVIAYYLRHTFITNALNNDVSPQKVAELAGHSLRMTMNIYAHLGKNKVVMHDALRQATGQAPNAKREDVA